MAVLFTSQEALKELPFLAEPGLYQAVSLALWLYLDKHWAFEASINKAAEKRNYKPKTHIRRAMKQVIPEDVFEARALEASENYSARMRGNPD